MMTSATSMELKPLLLTPTQYQLEGADHLVTARKAILGDEMGLGKTGEAAIAWRNIGLLGPALLIGRPAAQAVWLQQAEQWGIQIPLTVTGTPKQRKELWADRDQYTFHAATIQTLTNDLKSGICPQDWPVVIYDEAHRVNNRKTVGWKTMKQIKCQYLFLLTGSPMRKGFWDLWALLNLCDPKSFSSYWKFVQTFGFTQLNELGFWEILCLRDEALFARRIAPYFIRREKKDVRPQLPQKRRILDLRIDELQPHQNVMYNEMLDDLVMNLSNEDILIAQNELVKITRLRQILCCPKLLDPDIGEWGACLELLGEKIEETEDHHFVVYTPFARAIPYISEFIQQKLPKQTIYHFRGGTLSPQDIIEQARLFRKSGGIAVCSIAFAESFELIPAEWAYFCGFSWSADENVQAEDRQHRMTTTASIFYYYPTHRNCIDSTLMIPALNVKANNMHDVYKSQRQLREALLHKPWT